MPRGGPRGSRRRQIDAALEPRVSRIETDSQLRVLPDHMGPHDRGLAVAAKRFRKRWLHVGQRRFRLREPTANLLGRKRAVIETNLIDRAAEIVAVAEVILPPTEGEATRARFPLAAHLLFAGGLAVDEQAKRVAVIGHGQMAPGLDGQRFPRLDREAIVASPTDVKPGLQHATGADREAVVAVGLLVKVLAHEPRHGLRGRREVGRKIRPELERELFGIKARCVRHFQMIGAIEPKAAAEPAEADVARRDRREWRPHGEDKREPVGPGDRFEAGIRRELPAIARCEHQSVHVSPLHPAA